MPEIDPILGLSPVIPVLVLDDPGTAPGIAAALVAGGLPVLEVTLRTPRAAAVIRAMAGVEGAVVGAGTVLNERDLDRALEAGARFIVSPGLTEGLAHAVARHPVPFLPGVSTAGDIMRGLDLGLSRFKFFPAEASGGIAALRALAAPFGAVRFCPTGGITPDTAAGWLAAPGVACIGGSWLAGRTDTDLDAIRARAAAAAALRA